MQIGIILNNDLHPKEDASLFTLVRYTLILNHTNRKGFPYQSPIVYQQLKFNLDGATNQKLYFYAIWIVSSERTQEASSSISWSLALFNRSLNHNNNSMTFMVLTLLVLDCAVPIETSNPLSRKLTAVDEYYTQYVTADSKPVIIVFGLEKLFQ